MLTLSNLYLKMSYFVPMNLKKMHQLNEEGLKKRYDVNCDEDDEVAVAVAVADDDDAVNDE